MVLIENVDALTSWLLKELKPICDAQPSDLATYVLSLIRKPDKTDDETREFCAAQLDIFLGGNTKRFVEKLFEVLKDGSYIEQKQSAPPAKKKEEEAIKEDKEESKPTREVKSDVRKTTSRREDSKKDELKVVVRRRISPPASELKKESSNRDRDVRRRSRSPRRGERRGDRRRSPERRQRRSRSRSRSGDRRKSGEKKRRCRDYDEKGYCTRGDACPYDHGSDPVVFDRDSMDLMGGIAKAPFNMSVPPPGYNPLNPPPPGVEGIYNAPNTGSNVEGYNPEAPALTTANYSVPPPPLPLQMTQAPWRPSSFSVNTVPGYDPSSGVPVDPSSGPIHTGPMRGGMRGRGRGRGGHQGGHFGGQNRGIGDGKTIHVSRIPQEQNNIAKLNEHFAQFGNISNIQVRFDGDPESALISFYCKAEATAAVKSPAPVLNNRFIRVNYYRPPEGENGSPNNADVATSLSSGIRVSKPNTAPVEKPKVATVGESKFVNTAFSAKEKAKIKKKELSSKAKSILEAHKKQTTLLESLLKQQKTILTKLKDESTDQETKKRLKDMAKSTSEQITVAKTLSTSLSRQLEENTAALKENQALLDELLKKGAEEEEADAVSRKRTAPLHQSSPIKKKATGTALLVTGFTLDDEQKVTEAMEAVGELLDIEIQPGAGSEISAVYIYKDSDDAEKVLKSPPEVSGNVLKVSTTTNKLEEQPQPVQDLSSPIELEAAE